MRPWPCENYVFAVSQTELIKLLTSDTSKLEDPHSLFGVGIGC